MVISTSAQRKALSCWFMSWQKHLISKTTSRKRSARWKHIVKLLSLHCIILARLRVSAFRNALPGELAQMRAAHLSADSPGGLLLHQAQIRCAWDKVSVLRVSLKPKLKDSGSQQKRTPVLLLPALTATPVGCKSSLSPLKCGLAANSQASVGSKDTHLPKDHVRLKLIQCCT